MVSGLPRGVREEASGLVVDVVERGVAQLAGNLAKKVLRAGRRGILECVTRPFHVHRVWGARTRGSELEKATESHRTAGAAP